MAVQGIAQEVRQLGQDRLDQVKLGAQLFNFAAGDSAALAHHDIDRIPGRQAHEDENDNGDAKHDGNGV